MAKANYSVVKKPQITVSNDKIYCRVCRNTESSTAFYTTTNPMLDTNKFMSICRDCCNKIYDDYFAIYSNMEKSLYLTCQDLDVRFSLDSLKQTQSHIEGLITKGKIAKKVFGYYKSKLESTGKANEKLDSFRFKDSDHLVKIQTDTDTSSDTEDFEMSESNFVLTEEIIKHWGKGKDFLEYEFLEEQMYKIKTSFECPDYGMEMIMKDICFINMDIERIRQDGKNAKGDINKLIETRSKLMNDAKMKPIQSTGAEANDQITFGMLIKKLENDRPTDEPLDEWKDPDNFEKWQKIFVGHLADMNDIENDAVKEYRELIKPYTVARQDEDGEN